MIVAGLKLTVLGMSVVMFFLILLFLFINLARGLLSAVSAREFAEIEAAELRRRKKSALRMHDDLLVAVISAAIASHRGRTNQT